MEHEDVRQEIAEAINRQVVEVPGDVGGVVPPTMPTGRMDGLRLTAQYMTSFGNVLLRVGMAINDAMLACPADGEAAPAELINHMRSFTSGAERDDPVPLTALAYLARVVTGDDVLQKRPELSVILGELEGWAEGLAQPDWRDLRDMYATASRLSSEDIGRVGQIMDAIKVEMERGEIGE